MPRHSEGKAFGLGALSAGAVISVVAGAYKVGEAVLHLRRLHAVGKENDVFVRMVERVRLDLAEVDRLLALPEVKLALSRSPEKVQWIKRTITTLRVAMEEKAKYTESVRKAVEGGRILGLRKRIWWVLEEHEKLVNRRMELAMCHLGLLQVLAFLAPLEPLACCQPESMYRANEKFYREADEMIRYHDIPERREPFGVNVYSDRRVEDIRESSRPRDLVDSDVSESSLEPEYQLMAISTPLLDNMKLQRAISSWRIRESLAILNEKASILTGESNEMFKAPVREMFSLIKESNGNIEKAEKEISWLIKELKENIEMAEKRRSTCAEQRNETIERTGENMTGTDTDTITVAVGDMNETRKKRTMLSSREGLFDIVVRDYNPFIVPLYALVILGGSYRMLFWWVYCFPASMTTTITVCLVFIDLAWAIVSLPFAVVLAFGKFNSL
jgi:hypothetical protein